jgi:2-amino-4-hydroxy-6-hydroxymethyldihydropteridine diphosphokinase
MTAAIALGSNLPSPFGPPEANLREALSRMAALGQVTAVSSFHTTEPVGYLDQPTFHNAAALLATDLNPIELLHGLLAIEFAMGRDRANAPAKGPRIIDLDLLLYTDKHGVNEVLSVPNLALPHPSMHERRFVLAPLAEIAPNLTHPTLHADIASLLASLLPINERPRR